VDGLIISGPRGEQIEGTQRPTHLIPILKHPKTKEPKTTKRISKAQD
jgi:hypothetical protein